MTSPTDSALVERLKAGVPCCDPDFNNGEGLFYVEEASETMAEAAARIEALEAGLRKIETARTAMDGGSIAECRRIAAHTLKDQEHG